MIEKEVTVILIWKYSLKYLESAVRLTEKNFSSPVFQSIVDSIAKVF